MEAINSVRIGSSIHYGNRAQSKSRQGEVIVPNDGSINISVAGLAAVCHYYDES